MGLTIHYDLSLPAKTAPETVRKKLEALRQKCLDLPFKEVDRGLLDMSGDACDYKREKDADLRWFLIQAGMWINVGHDESGKAQQTEGVENDLRMKVVPSRIIGFKTWPGEGCEKANVGLCQMPRTVRVENLGGRAPKHSTLELGGGWHWGSFCKTQYANDPRCGGIENFLRCHLCVVAMLDAAKELGFKVAVDDEGGYWKSRDLPALVKNIDAYDAHIAAIGGALKDAVGDGVSSAMSGRPDFERLEAKGQALNPGLAKLVAMTMRHIPDKRQE